jgi:hypothetical protein
MQCQIASEKIATFQLIKTRELAADCQFDPSFSNPEFLLGFCIFMGT